MRFGGFGFNQQFGFTAPTQSGGAAAPAGYAAWPSLIGAEMMVNGDCSSATGWTLDTGIAIALGKQTWTAISSGGAINSGTADTAIIQGATYRCAQTYDSISGGALQQSVAGSLGTAVSTAGAVTQDIVAGDPVGEGGWVIQRSSGTVTAQLDNFSVKSVGMVGVEADWAFVGDVFWGSGPPAGVQFDAGAGATASLTGAALTAFDAGVSNSTACSVTLSQGPSGFAGAGTLTVTMKGGTPVSFVFTGTDNEAITHTVTSGVGSGFVLTAGAGSPVPFIVNVDIALA